MAWELISIIILILALLVWSLPLFITVKLFGGKTSLLKALGVNISIGIIVIVVNEILNVWASAAIFILTLILYREFFRLKWWKALVVWLVQGIVGVVVFAILAILGLGLFLL